MRNANLKCPHCGNEQAVAIPEGKCLAFHKCEKCEQMIFVPDGSKNCCIICEYSDTLCPVGHKE